MPTSYASSSLYLFPPIPPFPCPTENPPCDLHFSDSVPVLVVCLVFVFLVFLSFIFLGSLVDSCEFVITRLKTENLESSKRKGKSYLQTSSHKTMSLFLKRNLAGKKGLERSIWSHERQGPTPRIVYPIKLSFRMEGHIKCFPGKVKLKEFIITKPLLYEMLKGLTKKRKIKTMNSKMTTNS